MAINRSAALREYETQEEQEEDIPMAAPKPLTSLSPGAGSILRSSHVRKPTRDLASIGLPRDVPLKMPLSEALMLDRGEGRLVR
jgi:hypothetical protein